ncbi:hypothetical protein [Thiomicrorhabdus aquaedulcis]|uniref:hypothetical protein n=1 Tax=Thiomicrorhabdus aquaedulcis TaxID=2211106 RepID=UPI000FDB87E7|nr:hypothetical protein [Thiomicrorhabdus aquaedulcis]
MNWALRGETPEQVINRISGLIDSRRPTGKMPPELIPYDLDLLSSNERSEFHAAKMAIQEFNKGNKAEEAKARIKARITKRNENKIAFHVCA